MAAVSDLDEQPAGGGVAGLGNRPLKAGLPRGGLGRLSVVKSFGPTVSWILAPEELGRVSNVEPTQRQCCGNDSYGVAQR